MKTQDNKFLIKYCYRVYFLAILFLIALPGYKLVAQCPPNIDFEQGNFNGWQCYTGSVASNTGMLTLNPSLPITNRHTMLSALPGNGNDFWGGFPQNCPNGSGHSIRLGNGLGGRGAERVSYTFDIPLSQNIFSLSFNYAIILEDFGHTPAQQPRLTIEVLNLTDNIPDPCSSFDFVVDANLPGFFISPESSPSLPVRCKDWSAASINLDGKAGKTIQISFTTTDCSQGAHFGYAYLDISSQCGSSFIGSTFCPTDTLVKITAPFGFQSYRWFDIANTTLGLQQSLSFNPPPPSGTTVFVELTPYDGYGCVQTLTATLLSTLTVTADAGPDRCDNLPIQIGMPPQPGLVYKWKPSAGLSNPDISNPIATPVTSTQYELTVSSIGGGCIAKDTINVYTDIVSDSIQLIGSASFCSGSGQSAILKVLPADSVQWFKDNIAISGANQTQLNITQSGAYYAIVFNTARCNKTTAVKQINIYESPVAGFAINAPAQCFAVNQFVFTNSSTVSTGTLTYLWSLGDGATATTTNVTHTYAAPGNYIVKLIADVGGICKDSITYSVVVYPTPVADFTVQTVCENLPLPIINRTSNNTTTTLNYLWDFGNGQSSTLRNPVYSYPAAGVYTISLTVNSNQCPLASDTKQLDVIIEAPVPGIAYPEKDAVFNFPEPLQARQIGRSVVWSPATSLDNRFSYTPYFKGLSQQLYTIQLKTLSGCITVDTQLVKTHKKIEIYVPTAFTPGNIDGYNDYLRPVLMGFVKVNYFRVYNRWGKLLFQMQSDQPGWNGRVNGQKAELQTVIWMIEAVDVDGKIHKRQGTAVLLH